MARSKSNPQLVLRPQHLVVPLRLALERGPASTDAVLAAELGMTTFEVQGAVERTVAAQLAFKDVSGKATVVVAALRLFVLHGVSLQFSQNAINLVAIQAVLTGASASFHAKSLTFGSTSAQTFDLTRA